MNVEELLLKKKIEYRNSGGDYLIRCLNPNHEDHNPSMRIDQVLGIYNCLSCGFKGNIFDFFDEASDKLSIAREKLKRKLLEIRSSSVGLEMPENMTPYEGGWRNISPETYKKFGAFRAPQPHFISRIVFPIRDITGRIVLFQGRDDTGLLDKKYNNYPRHILMPLFPSVKPIQGNIVLVEGLFDMLNLHDKGIENAIVNFGVNAFNKDKATNLAMQGVTGIDIIFDGDTAGEKGAEEVKEIAEELNINTRVIKLPAGVDPGSLSGAQVQTLKRQLYES